MTIWISKLLGPILLALSIPMMVTPTTLQETTRVVAPDVVDRLGGAMMNRPTMTRIVGGFWGLLGLFLTLKAYAQTWRKRSSGELASSAFQETPALIASRSFAKAERIRSRPSSMLTAG